MASLVIKTAEELSDPAREARWIARRAARETDVLQRILRTFVERGGPVPVGDIVAAFQGRPIESVHDALSALDDDDLIVVREGYVEIAYPFSAGPTPFVVRLPDGTERYTCCAVDSLGVATMLGRRVGVTTAIRPSTSPPNRMRWGRRRMV